MINLNEMLGIQPSAAAHAAGIDNILELLHWFVVILFIPWIAFFVYCLFRFRKSRTPKADYHGVKGKTYKYTEIVVVVVDALFLLVLAIPLWAKRANPEPAEIGTAMTIRVVGEQFAWNIHYPGADGKLGRVDAGLVTAENPLGLDKSDPAAKDDVITRNLLHLPVGKPVVVDISSKDVIHSFKILQMRVCQDAIPGMSIKSWFTPTKTSIEMRDYYTASYPTEKGAVRPGYVAMENYAAKDGTSILKKGEMVGDAKLAVLKTAGILKITAAPENPIEIICAQLCGNGHAGMKGYVTVETQTEFDAWMAKQAAAGAGGGSLE